MITQLDRAREPWLSEHDGTAGSAYGEPLEAAGNTATARAIYDELIRSGYLIGYYALARPEHDSDNAERARDLLRRYLDADDEPDEQTQLVAGVLGHWLWRDANDPDAKTYSSAEPTPIRAQVPTWRICIAPRDAPRRRRAS